jgi:hypothetical protein
MLLSFGGEKKKILLNYALSWRRGILRCNSIGVGWFGLTKSDCAF